jgi:predicted ATPase/transcriptional regulator with XRE-family HTH domain
MVPRTSETLETLSTRLKCSRTDRGWTQAELADQSGVSASTIGKLEQGALRRPRYETLELLAKGLALSPQEQAHFITLGRGHRPPEIIPLPAHIQLVETSPLHRCHLPIPPTPLLGREKELEQLMAQLVRPQVRLLTLVGPGGCGKTHLGIEVAGMVAARYPDGVWFVSLAPIRDPTLVPAAVAHVLGVTERAHESLAEVLATFLSTRRLLLVLDNFEHLPAAAHQVATWLQCCPHLHLLVTSRRALHLRGEYEFPVSPLELPDPHSVPTLADLARVPAVALFLERACAADPRFSLTKQNSASIAAICQQLDGLPLALELAAPLVKVFSPEVLGTHLAHRLDLLTDGPCDLPERQRSLRATLEWSYDLLDPPEQALFRRMAVFVSGGTLAAVKAVCTTIDIPPNTVVRVLAELCASSLIQQRETPEGGTRFNLLETIREYAWEGVVARDEAYCAQQQHASYYLTMAEAAQQLLGGPEQAICLSQLEEEHDNLRAALQWWLNRDEITLGLRLATALRQFWEQRGHFSEGRRWFEQLLALASDHETPVPTSLYTKALNSVGVLAYAQGDFEHAVAWYEQSLAACQRELDQDGTASAYHNLGIVAMEQGNLERARELYQQSLAIRRALGDPKRETNSLQGLGIVARLQGDLVQARCWFEASLAIRREAEDENGIASSLNTLGTVAVDQGDYDCAVQLFMEALAIRRHLQHRRGVADTLDNLAHVSCLRGEYTQAQLLAEEAVVLFQHIENNAGLAASLLTLAWIACVQEDVARAAGLSRRSLLLCRKSKSRVHIAECLEMLAYVACKHGCLEVAAQRLGSAAALRETMGVPIERLDQTICETAIGYLHRQLGQDRFMAAWAAGAGRPLDEVIDEAITEDVRKSDGRPGLDLEITLSVKMLPSTQGL